MAGDNGAGSSLQTGVNPFLVPIYDVDQFQPASAAMSYVGVGASAPTLPAMSQSSASDQTGVTTYGGQTSASADVGGAKADATLMVGLPPQLFWVLVLGFLAYVVLWRVHFKGG